jgi:thioredoxin-dependent peroxiredoxin
MSIHLGTTAPDFEAETPVNWQHGEEVIIAGSVSNDEAKEMFGSWEEPKPYIRIVAQPR